MRASPPSLFRWFLAYPFLRSTSTGTSRWLVSAGSPTSNISRQTTAAFLPGLSGSHRTTSVTAHHALFSTTSHFYSPDVLTSTSSATVKRIVGLQQKAKKRREAGETVVEGPRMVMDLLRNPDTRPLVRQIVVSTDLEDSIRDELENYLQETSSDLSLSVHSALPNVIKACSDTVTPQGIVARVQIPLWDFEQDAKSEPRQPNQAPLYLVLDGVSDPGNLGTLLRSSVAVGVTAVLLLPGSCDVWNPKAVRSAMGGSFLVPAFSFSSWEETLDQLEDWDCERVWAATMLEDSHGRVVSSAHYDIDWNSQPQALVIGNEGNGLSRVIRESLQTDSAKVQAVHVPMQGTIESLNAAVCGSVILFEYMRQWQQNEH